MSEITPQSKHYTYASLNNRFAAAFIDVLILGSSTFFLLLLTLFLSGNNVIIRLAIWPITSLLYSVYYIFFTWMYGATPGKMALHIKVVTTSLTRVSFWRVMLRELVGKWASASILYLGYFWILWDSKRQGWHDKIAGTYVVESARITNVYVDTGKKSKYATLLTILYLLFGFPAVFLVLYISFFRPFQVSGVSMSPTYKSGEYIMTKIVSPFNTDIQRADVIILKSPTNPDTDLIKRVIGLPGETILLNNGAVYINGKMLSESSYLSPDIKTYGATFIQDNQSMTIPNNDYFVMGDNRPESPDSRSWGFVPRENIISKFLFCYANCQK